MRTHLKPLICVVMCLSQIACATRLVQPGKTTYEEAIQSFLITKDGGTLVIIGKADHYVFTLDDRLKALLLWEGRQKLYPRFEGFVVEPDQHISGRYTLRAKHEDLAESEREFLLKNGFRYTSNSMENLELTAAISGKRYSAGDKRIPDSVAFRAPWGLYIEERDSELTVAVKKTLTPVAIAADGVIFLGTLILFAPVGIFCAMRQVSGPCFGGGDRVH